MAELAYDDILARSRPGPPFSNGTEGLSWQENWCDRCLRDAPFRNMGKGTGCPIWMVALLGRTPAEWMENRRYSLGDQWTCIEYRAPGGRGPEPKPVPDPPDQDALFDRPPTRPRMLTPLPEQPAERAAELEVAR